MKSKRDTHKQKIYRSIIKMFRYDMCIMYRLSILSYKSILKSLLDSLWFNFCFIFLNKSHYFLLLKMQIALTFWDLIAIKTTLCWELASNRLILRSGHLTLKNYDGILHEIFKPVKRTKRSRVITFFTNKLYFSVFIFNLLLTSIINHSGSMILRAPMIFHDERAPYKTLWRILDTRNLCENATKLNLFSY